MKKNSFIYEDEKLGRMMMIETEDNKTEIHRLKTETNPIFTLDAMWWDLDNINREFSKNRKEIEDAFSHHVINGLYGKINEIMEGMESLSKDEVDQLRACIADTFGL